MLIHKKTDKKVSVLSGHRKVAEVLGNKIYTEIYY
jgi:hypothetical protein